VDGNIKDHRQDTFEQRLFEVLAPEMNNPNRVLDALTEALTFIMSVQCPDCRKNLALELKRRIPRMLREANAAGADFFGNDRSSSCH
jgi:hypothetical protein